MRFHRDVDVASIAELVVAEQDCCGFFTFTLGVAATGVTLDVTAPPAAQPMIDGLLGAAP
jgi:hypothetical protein